MRNSDSRRVGNFHDLLKSESQEVSDPKPEGPDSGLTTRANAYD